MGRAQQRQRGGLLIPALTNDGRPIVLPDWWSAHGPVYEGNRLISNGKISKGATKREKVKAKKVKKAKQARKDAQLAKLAAIARDRSQPTPVRMHALVQLDEAVAGKSAVKGKLLTKKANKSLERQAFAPDVHARARALDAMFPVGA